MICERSEGRHNIDLDLLGIKKEQIIILSIAGSNMYGTATEASDKDYLGIYLPTEKQLKLGTWKNQIHLPKESGVDLQMWSIHYFLKLACQGETMAIDLLHAPYSCWIYYNPDIWSSLVNQRIQFYTKEMKSYVSYARNHATKYGVKGNRLNTLETVVNFLKRLPEDVKLLEVWDALPTGQHIHFLDTKPYRMYQVCGKMYQETVNIGYALTNLNKTLTEYGKRAKMAANNEGIDWKGLSHAIRACEQVHFILQNDDYSYPLKNRKFITNVKLGKIDFSIVDAVLTDWMDIIDDLIKKSNLPEKIELSTWHENWLLPVINQKWI